MLDTSDPRPLQRYVRRRRLCLNSSVNVNRRQARKARDDGSQRERNEIEREHVCQPRGRISQQSNRPTVDQPTGKVFSSSLTRNIVGRFFGARFSILTVCPKMPRGRLASLCQFPEELRPYHTFSAMQMLPSVQKMNRSSRQDPGHGVHIAQT